MVVKMRCLCLCNNKKKWKRERVYVRWLIWWWLWLCYVACVMLVVCGDGGGTPYVHHLLFFPRSRRPDARRSKY
ncbi:hypothetical protein QJS10_CPB19g00795 [Acorus calamus]|uniref:Uncharacterized protein n=1 Tax=Acorus calamus TaxID=4465 RepID=A0AAV9CGW6_ACOCL|nr:hypothetical protein QJS10_CPB19g00795 [Acorus calamus]